MLALVVKMDYVKVALGVLKAVVYIEGGGQMGSRREDREIAKLHKPSRNVDSQMCLLDVD